MHTTFRTMLAGSICISALLGAATCLTSTTSFAQEAADVSEAAPDISSLAAAEEPPAFDSVDEALAAYKTALADDDIGALARLFGLDAEKLKADENAAETFKLLREGTARQLIVKGGDDRKLLAIGAKLWPLPFPLVKGQDGKWAFDTYAGLEEIVNRRVGENELEAIETARDYVEAQRDYADEDRDGDGVLEFAQKLVSSEGMTDGLYWPTDEINGESPAGEFADQAELEGAKKGEGYFGYRFRILTGQGDQIAGGAYDYIINGNMIAGFGLLAWPITYGETGVKTFAVNQSGIVYEADLGPATEQIVKYIDRFNPDDSWKVVPD
ncbi:DUF2950 domain-containing protein [Arvimicrobium flavum]|uniref:DUF2950 domain-containing protein n=1 Tax=Arvimicrobium flavum TaxID=3393320 RepID=UPI00237C10D1|nr:DUF2950 domain-containing protein [Mesorhizobium shangrilense]